MQKYNTKRIVLLAVFVAIASVLHVVESWIPVPLPLPGFKLGLANTVSLIVIVMYGWRNTLYVILLRVFIGSLFGGMFLGPAFVMSISGALFSSVVMLYIYRKWYPFFSLMGISILGAVAHNIAQVVVASILVSSATVLLYLPYLILVAVPIGLGTGLIANYFLLKFPKEVWG